MMNSFVTKCTAFLFCLIGVVQVAQGGMLYQASLKDGDYGGGFKVGTYLSSSPWNASGSTGGDLSTLGIVDSPTGVTFTTPNDVINFSLGADGYDRINFRKSGTVSVFFKADLQDFRGGQPFVDNYGFNQFNSGQATFGTGMYRNAGADGTAYTADDKVRFWWNTWHNSVWYNHVDTNEILLDFDQWHHLGLTWDEIPNRFEVWVDGVLMASDNLPSSGAWGTSTGLGSAYNFALGEIHERRFGNGSPFGVMFGDLEIWDEYRALGNTQPPTPPAVPEPAGLAIWSLLGMVGMVCAWRKRRKRPTSI